eukprot:CAMPEP_0201486802 /NCGR_PEP_ID=MMETSP0151_2-20130828/10855_1 /ASSEMBLY_ACC=CAM_ASM_000257 /TAXON_ID=200890 /ORGANISM="Paramoeba atlantica, Strain 621/1 / CCAP 1560/9" /LENGTH=157 /DNA_ID=CAMNT_0047871635 /DNA_START=102 /DNA_END=576 /DNA_ORIENTATION=-
MARIKDEVFEEEEGRGDTILSFEEKEEGEKSLSLGGEKQTNETLSPRDLLLVVLDIIAFIAVSFIVLWTTDDNRRFSCDQEGHLPTPTRITECNEDHHRIKLFLREFAVALFFFLVIFASASRTSSNAYQNHKKEKYKERENKEKKKKKKKKDENRL